MLGMENFTTEFRNYEDDAWYIVMVTIEDNTLRVRIKKITDDRRPIF
jgi:siroheme synthase (precorrin-2 oxidase/ferrochelatase)